MRRSDRPSCLLYDPILHYEMACSNLLTLLSPSFVRLRSGTFWLQDTSRIWPVMIDMVDQTMEEPKYYVAFSRPFGPNTFPGRLWCSQCLAHSEQPGHSQRHCDRNCCRDHH